MLRKFMLKIWKTTHWWFYKNIFLIYFSPLAKTYRFWQTRKWRIGRCTKFLFENWFQSWGWSLADTSKWSHWRKQRQRCQMVWAILGPRCKFLISRSFSKKYFTVWSERFLYKVAPPELKISPIMYFVIRNSVVLSKILKIVVPFWLLFVYVDYYYQNNQFYRVKNRIFKILLLWHNNFQYFG